MSGPTPQPAQRCGPEEERMSDAMPAPSRKRAEWWCRLVLRVLALSFVVVGAIFLFFPDATIRTMNAVGALLGEFTPAPASALRFWLSLTTGYMVLVTAFAYLAQRDLQRHRLMLLLLALGKGTSSLTCLGFYIGAHDAFIYLANFLVDGSIAATALLIWVLVPSMSAAAETRPARYDLTAERVFNAIVEAMVPGGGAFEEGARGTIGIGEIESFIAAAGPGAPRALRVLLRLFELTPYVLPPFHWRRFSHLPLTERTLVLEAWEQSWLVPRRLAMHVLKMLVLTHFYSRPEVAARLRYPHPLERVPRPQERAA
jgi:hypothetical protein